MAIGDKIELAFKSELQTVEQSVNTLNTQINTATTGIESRVNTLEGNNIELLQLRVDIDSVDDQLNNVTTGLVGAVTTIDNQLNEVGTGVVARLEDLEVGGTSTMKFRTHSTSGTYEDGEVVQRNNELYKANSIIDGNTSPIPFIEGVGTNTWARYSVPSGTAQHAAVFGPTGILAASNVTSDELDTLDRDSPATITTIADADKIILNSSSGGMMQVLVSRLWTYISSKFATGAFSDNTTTVFADKSCVLISNSSGKAVPLSNITATELSYLDGISSNIQNQMASKKTYATNVMRVAASGTVSTTGTKLTGGLGTYTVSKIGTGEYRITGLTVAPLEQSSVLIECISDDDNVSVVYNKGTGDFNVRFYDIPNMSLQDTTFRFRWVVLY